MGEGRKKGPGGGGNPLNYKVVGNPKSTKSKPNTIWVNTDVKIPKHYLQPEQPEKMQPGEVWIKTGDSGDVGFNALKKNDITLHIISAKQFIADKLVPLDAEIYQNGEWIVWTKAIPDGSLFYDGDECADMTGGWWQNTALTLANYPNTGELIIGNTIKCTPAAGVSAMASTKKKIDFAKYSTLYVTIDAVIDGEFFIHTNETGNVMNQLVSSKATAPGEFAIDVKAVNVEAFFTFGAAANASVNRNVTASKIRIE